jgi:hypothetical protein
MGINDIRTSIEGYIWIIRNIKNRSKKIESIFLLDDLYLRITKTYPQLTAEIKDAIRGIQYESAVVGTSCCRRCRYTKWQDCKCFITKTNAFAPEPSKINLN